MHTNLSRSVLLLSTLMLALGSSLGWADESNNCALDYQVLHSFGNTNQLGTYPNSLIEGSDGKLYGTTADGGYGGIGLSSTGVVYVINHDGMGYQVLHDFTGGTNDGAQPTSLIEASDGMLFGTTWQGGTNHNGAVFQLNKDGSGFGLWEIGPGTKPFALLEATNGVLYGWAAIPTPTFTTNVIFRINRDGTGFAIVREFDPNAVAFGNDLIQGSDGLLYGTYVASGGGAVFKLGLDGAGYGVVHSDPNWFEFDFVRLSEGSDGVLYGAAALGPSFSGSIFKLNRDGSGYAELFSFPLSEQGQSPAKVIEGFDGKLYGVAISGGTNSYGTVFRLNKDGSGYVAFLHLSEGSYGPRGPRHLRQGTNGALYCITEGGGRGVRGALFTLATNGSNYSVLWDFQETGGLDGYYAQSPVIEAGDGKIYGTTVNGGLSGGGTVYRLNPDATGYELIHSFTGVGNEGMLPRAGLLEASDGFLYGTTKHGGADNVGTIFKMNRDGSGFATLQEFEFASPIGRWPAGSLVEGTNGALYGVTEFDGANNRGTIFKINREGTGFITLHDFNSNDQPSEAVGLLVGSDGAIYGTATGGLFGTGGVVFRINHDGGGYAVLRSFGSSLEDGSQPVGRLLEFSNVLYGATTAGGANDLGVVFRMNLDGTGYQVLRHLGGTATDAKSPLAGLVLGPCGVLYGTASGGGAFEKGALFRLQIDGSDYSVIHDFNAATGDGKNPQVGLFASGDGTLYGTSRNGGFMDIGTVFKLFSATEENSPPALVNVIPDQTNTYGSALVFSFGANTFTNAESGQSLSYTASNLPPGISFTGPTRTFSGTPTNVGVYAVIVIATDDGTPALSTNDVFNFAITPAPLIVTANDTNRFFGQPNPPLTGTLVGVTNGDNITVTFETPANPASPAGAYPITPVFSDPDTRLGQYAVTTNLGTLTVLCATNLIVTATNDSGLGSLREAITLANASCAPAPVLISFNIPGPGVQTIAPLTALPTITRAVTIDGYTQSGASANTLPVGSDAILLIELSGTNVPGNTGLYLNASAAGSTVRGLVINRFAYGIALDFSQGVAVEGCFIGTDATGTNAQPNDIGIATTGGTGHRIGGSTPAARNVVGGHAATYGIWISGTASNLVIGNYVGLGADGTTPLPTGAGVYLAGAASGNRIGGFTTGERNVISANGNGCYDNSDGGNFFQGNFIGTDAPGVLNRGNSVGITLVGSGSVIGGTNAGAGNLISGRNGTGLLLNGTGNVVAGNLIGTDITGQLALGNEYDGLLIYGSSNVIGGTVAAARNVIAANRYAVYFVNPAASGNRVLGNFIGTDITGTNALGNAAGVVAFAAPANFIGGASAGEGNVISGNTNAGIFLLEQISTNYVIQGNFIGTDASGTVPVPNGQGIYVGSGGNLIGGPGGAAGNLISANTGIGVTIDFYSYATNNTVLGNSIFGNGALGIDLAGNGATPNDPADADDGPNHFQNSPVLTNVMTSGGLVGLDFFVDSHAGTSTYPLTVEFFLADSLASGEGRTLIHRAIYSTPQSLTNILFTPLAPTSVTDHLVATTTDANGNSSEFSTPAAISLPASPTLNIAATVGGLEISWPTGGFNFVLETTTSLAPPANWQVVTNGITEINALNTYFETNTTVEPGRFFRLRLP